MSRQIYSQESCLPQKVSLSAMGDPFLPPSGVIGHTLAMQKALL
jgi:hypothetical protein